MLLRVFEEPPADRCYTVWVADRTGVANRLTKDSRPGRSLPRTAHHRNAIARHKKSAGYSAMALPRLREDFRLLHPATGLTVTGEL